MPDTGTSHVNRIVDAEKHHSNSAAGSPRTLLPWTIEALLNAYKAGSLTPSQMVAKALDRAKDIDPLGRVFVALEVLRAMERAHELDASGFLEDLPLYGIPLSIKDVIDVQGLQTKCGSPHQKTTDAVADAEVVKRLKKAGAVIIGKVATTEFAAAGYHPDTEPPQNPLSVHHVAGVSSSGSAVSVSGGIVLGSFGTDTGGSIRMPASACGVVGLKPTFGAISRAGIVPLAASLDHCGVIAGNVEDVKRLFTAVRGRDVNDPATLQTLPGWPRKRNKQVLKIGWDERFCSEGVDSAMRNAAHSALEFLTNSGYQVLSIDIGTALHVCSYWKDLVACEFKARASQRITAPEKLGPVISDLIAYAETVPGERICEALKHREALIGLLHKVFHSVDIIITPTEPFSTRTWEEFPPQFLTPGRSLARVLRFAAPFNFAGCPSLAIPFGIAPSGMPTSVQLIAAWNDEEVLFRLGNKLEMAEGSVQAAAFRHAPNI